MKRAARALHVARATCGARAHVTHVQQVVKVWHLTLTSWRWKFHEQAEGGCKSEKVFISSFVRTELENCVSLLKLYLDKVVKSPPNLHATETNIILFRLMQFMFLNTFSPLEPVFPFCPTGPEGPVSPCGENIM